MADVNEEIIEQYLKLVKKWFYIGDLSFTVPNNYSNIDILAYDPATSTYYDVEVKYRSAFTIPEKDKKGKDVSDQSVAFLVDQFAKYPNRDIIIKEYCYGKKAEKILVTTKQMMGKSENKREVMEHAFVQGMKARGYEASVWYFDDIIPELVAKVKESGIYRTELLQTIRMMKVYGTK